MLLKGGLAASASFCLLSTMGKQSGLPTSGSLAPLTGNGSVLSYLRGCLHMKLVLFLTDSRTAPEAGIPGQGGHSGLFCTPLKGNTHVVKRPSPQHTTPGSSCWIKVQAAPLWEPHQATPSLIPLNDLYSDCCHQASLLPVSYTHTSTRK